MIIKDGAKMSKSKGNVVSPDNLIAKYGVDTLRLYTLFIGPPEKDAEWNDRGVEGSWRFLNRVWRLIDKLSAISFQLSAKELKAELRRKTHQTIKKVTEDLGPGFHFNTAISAIMELVNEIYKALEEKRLAGAGLDVLVEEPANPNNPLLKMEQVVVTSHTAFYSEEALEELQEKAAQKVAAALTGKIPQPLVNPEVLNKA